MRWHVIEPLTPEEPHHLHHHPRYRWINVDLQFTDFILFIHSNWQTLPLLELDVS